MTDPHVAVTDYLTNLRDGNCDYQSESRLVGEFALDAIADRTDDDDDPPVDPREVAAAILDDVAYVALSAATDLRGLGTASPDTAHAYLLFFSEPTRPRRFAGMFRTRQRAEAEAERILDAQGGDADGIDMVVAPDATWEVVPCSYEDFG